MSTHPYRMLFGCEPEKYSNSILRIRAGSMVSANGNELFNFETHTDINLGTVGLNGMLESLPQNGDGLYPYMISNGVTHGFVLSKSIIYTNANMPAGYTVKRKLPFGFIYNSARGGIPDYHLAHWPSPQIIFTGREYSSLWMPLNNGRAADWTDVDLSGFMPDNARMAHIMCEMRYTGRASSAYIRSSASQATGILVGSVSNVDTRVMIPHSIRVSSTRKIQYKNIGGCTLNIYIVGYSMTEAS